MAAAEEEEEDADLLRNVKNRALVTRTVRALLPVLLAF